MLDKEYRMGHFKNIENWNASYIPIETIIDDLTSLKNKDGATHLTIDYEDGKIYYGIWKNELETDSQYQSRIKKHNLDLERQREREFKLYQELKLKFENQ